MIYCSKCGKEVDTLAKRRHRCVKVKVKVVDFTNQTNFVCPANQVRWQV